MLSIVDGLMDIPHYYIGCLIVRFLFGFASDSLFVKLNQNRTMLSIVDGLMDIPHYYIGCLIVRFLFGFASDSLFVKPNQNRTNTQTAMLSIVDGLNSTKTKQILLSDKWISPITILVGQLAAQQSNYPKQHNLWEPDKGSVSKQARKARRCDSNLQI